MFKPEGDPKFDAISLGELEVNRVDQLGDRVTAKFAFVRSSHRQTMGWTKLEGHIFLSQASQELLSKLVASMERDAGQFIYNQDNERKEGSDGTEPKGLADGIEEAPQI